MPHSTDYQRFRLWAGIFSIGCNLGLIWAFAIFFTLADAQILENLPNWLWLLAPVGTFLAFGFTFDFLVGNVAERAFDKSTQSPREWIADWVHTAPGAALGLYLALLLFSVCGTVTPALRAFFILAMGALAFVCICWIPRFQIHRFQTSPPSSFEDALRPQLEKLGVPSWPVRWVKTENEREINGAIAPFGREIWLSLGVAQGLSPREAALLVTRDYWLTRTGKSNGGAFICVVWLLLGATLALFVPPQNSPLAFATTGAALVSTWCFAALFVWPRLNQKWMREADRFLLEHADVEELAELFERVQNFNASDIQLGAVKSGVFHPIPELSRRLENLKETSQ